MGNIVRHEEALTKELEGGVLRRVLSRTPEMMTVEITFPTGGVGKPHRHPHIQTSYVKSGEFEYEMEGEKVIVMEGDSLTFLPGELHGCLCRRSGVLVDVFTPAREDFLT